ncbi:MAG: phenylalanine--tRNA ligase subunit beta [Bacteroidetes bacterium]|nr:phenylalanine--tRNA ligase subunit beta [Bacteroidota bacterium]
MHISHRWLTDYLDISLSNEQTAEMLTNLGLEVEGILPYESIKGGLNGLVVGHVLSCEKHPNADRLKVTTVDIGTEVVQIVCGASNVAKGQKVPVATEGTTLYPSQGDPFVIKKSTIRGEESNGMICAEDEIGIGNSHEGILVLDGNLIPGAPLNEVLETYTDTIYEIGLTPNRSDAMSHYGVARDLRAGLALSSIQPPLNSVPISSFSTENHSTALEIQVDDSLAAPRYLGLVIRNLEVTDSPSWLKNRLESIGVKSINNVVDITNFVLHGLGQPLHAFDYDKIRGQKVIVRKAQLGERLLCLDQIDRKLDPEDLVICDTEGPMCIAGVFGGAQSGVTSTTTSIFLESAYFDPISIRKTAKRHALSTDASFRFERGIDIEFCEIALKRATNLIREVAGGTIVGEILESYPKEKEPVQLFLNYTKLNNILGYTIEKEIVKTILVNLDFRILSETENGLGIIAPLYRIDVTREIDVVEEILRVYGYNNIPIPDKLSSTLRRSKSSKNLTAQNKVSESLVSQGFHEILTNSLVPSHTNFGDQSVRLKNPLSAELDVLRDNMFYCSLQSVAFNLKRQRSDLKFFEFGKIYRNEHQSYFEENRLIILLTGNRLAENWIQSSEPSTFYDLKRYAALVLQRLNIEISDEMVISEEQTMFEHGLALYSGAHKLAELGEISKSLCQNLEIKQVVFGGVFYWDTLLSLVANHPKERLFRPISKYPTVRRDLALLVNKEVCYSEIKKIVKEAEPNLLQTINLFDVYTGDKIDTSMKSYAISLVFTDANKTLTDKQIDKSIDRILKMLGEKVNSTLR